MSTARRIVAFPLVRLFLVLIVMGMLVVGPAFALRQLNLRGPMIGEHLVTLALLASLWIVVRSVERRPFFATFFPLRSAARDLALGFALGAALLSAVVGVLAIMGGYAITGVAVSGVSGALAMLRALWFFFVVALFEEMLFRAVIFRLVEEMLGTWGALAVSALVFGVAHLGQPNSSAFAAVAIALEAGVLLGAIYLQHRTLWLPVGVHWAWNYVEGPIFATNVSGTTNDAALFTAKTQGPAIVTGGDFGPEAGLVAVVLCTAAGIYFSARAVKKRTTLAPMWSRARRDAVERVAAADQT